MIHFICTSNLQRIQRATNAATQDDWIIVGVSTQLTKEARDILTGIFEEFPNSAFLCENSAHLTDSASKRNITYEHFITLCERYSPIMSWY